MTRHGSDTKTHSLFSREREALLRASLSTLKVASGSGLLIGIVLAAGAANHSASLQTIVNAIAGHSGAFPLLVIAAALVPAALLSSGGLSFVFTKRFSSPIRALSAKLVDSLAHMFSFSVGGILASWIVFGLVRVTDGGSFVDWSPITVLVFIGTAVCAVTLQIAKYGDDLGLSPTTAWEEAIGLLAAAMSFCLVWFAATNLPVSLKAVH